MCLFREIFGFLNFPPVRRNVPPGRPAVDGRTPPPFTAAGLPVRPDRAPVLGPARCTLKNFFPHEFMYKKTRKSIKKHFLCFLFITAAARKAFRTAHSGPARCSGTLFFVNLCIFYFFYGEKPLKHRFPRFVFWGRVPRVFA